MSDGPRIQLAISAHGFGHLTQALALARALCARWPHLRLRVQCGHPREVIAERLGDHPFEHDRRSLDVGLVQPDPLRVDRDASRLAYAALHRDFAAKVRAEAAGLQAWRTDLLIADVPYLPIAAASDAGIPSVALASLTWDSVVETYFDPAGADVARWLAEMRDAYATTRLALLPAPALPGRVFPRRVEIPPLGLFGTRRADLRQRLGIPGDDLRPLVLCSLGGIPAARLPLDALAGQTGFHWLVNSPHLPQADHLHRVPPDPDLAYRHLIASVDAVVGKPGYGTAVEAAVLGLPLLFARRGDFPDEPCIIAWLQRHARCAEIGVEAWERGAFSEPLAALLAQPAPPRPRSDGAEVGAKLVAQLLGD